MTKNTSISTPNVVSRLAANKKFSPLATTLIEHFEPLKALLNVSLTHGTEGADTGQEYPHRRDTGMRIIFDNLCRSVYIQLRGEIKNAAGVRYDNIKDRMHKSENDLFAHAERYRSNPEDMDTDPRTFTLAHWSDVNTEKFRATNELFDAVCHLYEDWTGEQWKMRDANQTTAKMDPERAGKIRQGIMDMVEKRKLAAEAAA